MALEPCGVRSPQLAQVAMSPTGFPASVQSVRSGQGFPEYLSALFSANSSSGERTPWRKRATTNWRSPSARSRGTSGARRTGGLRRRCCLSGRNGFAFRLSSCARRERAQEKCDQDGWEESRSFHGGVLLLGLPKCVSLALHEVAARPSSSFWEGTALITQRTQSAPGRMTLDNRQSQIEIRQSIRPRSSTDRTRGFLNLKCGFDSRRGQIICERRLSSPSHHPVQAELPFAYAYPVCRDPQTDPVLPRADYIIASFTGEQTRIFRGEPEKGDARKSRQIARDS